MAKRNDNETTELTHREAMTSFVKGVAMTTASSLVVAVDAGGSILWGFVILMLVAAVVRGFVIDRSVLTVSSVDAGDEGFPDWDAILSIVHVLSMSLWASYVILLEDAFITVIATTTVAIYAFGTLSRYFLRAGLAKWRFYASFAPMGVAFLGLGVASHPRFFLAGALMLLVPNVLVTLAGQNRKFFETLMRNERRNMRAAMTDALTSLPNRAAFDREIDDRVSRGHSFSVLFVDIDDFKSINDTFGHEAGDRFLEESARRLAACVRPGVDFTARLSGDEFVLLIDGCSDAERIATEMVACMKRSFDSLPQQRTGVSVGVAFWPVHGATAAQVLSSADVALYAAKRSGRGVYRMFNDTMRLGEDTVLESSREGLRSAISSGLIRVGFRAWAKLDGASTALFDTKVEWLSEHTGKDGGGKRIARGCEAASMLNEYVMKRVGDFLRDCDRDAHVTVNLDRDMLLDDLVAVRSRLILEERGLNADRVSFAVPEAIFDTAGGTVAHACRRLRSEGFGVVVDGFGAVDGSIRGLMESEATGVVIHVPVCGERGGEQSPSPLPFVRAAQGAGLQVRLLSALPLAGYRPFLGDGVVCCDGPQSGRFLSADVVAARAMGVLPRPSCVPTGGASGVRQGQGIA